jgi:hypothetical protein
LLAAADVLTLALDRTEVGRSALVTLHQETPDVRVTLSAESAFRLIEAIDGEPAFVVQERLFRTHHSGHGWYVAALFDRLPRPRERFMKEKTLRPPKVILELSSEKEFLVALVWRGHVTS